MTKFEQIMQFQKMRAAINKGNSPEAYRLASRI